MTWTKLGVFASTNGTPGATVIALGRAPAGSSYSAAVYVEGTLNGVWGIYHSDDGVQRGRASTMTRTNSATPA